ncbi:MAG: hypothetical protein KAF41_00385 [Flavobacterium sp.]|nr:hypothetical protein [Flavobacterium sp.]PZO33745.1 MAG: hypothetical protein DCE86_03870 [Flavobacteriaceae bacterium]
MSLEHKNRLTDYLSNDPTKTSEPASTNGITNFEENYSGVKNVCFVLLDGKHIFLNYNYLVAGEFFPEENKIMLHFTSHKVTIQGYNLEKLYHDLMQHTLKMIVAINERYREGLKENFSVVVEIIWTN